MFNCDETAAYSATSLAFRDRLILEWNRTQQRQTFADSKRVYYLSLEFLMGRALDNAMLNIGQKDVAKAGLAELGFRIEDIIDQEHDAALGNGGLGRLAACFLDSLASLNFPAWGYGLRYRYGIFKQTSGWNPFIFTFSHSIFGVLRGTLRILADRTRCSRKSRFPSFGLQETSALALQPILEPPMANDATWSSRP